MKKIETIIKNTTEKNQDKVDWTKVWSSKYPILKTYQKEVNISEYSLHDQTVSFVHPEEV